MSNKPFLRFVPVACVVIMLVGIVSMVFRYQIFQTDEGRYIFIGVSVGVLALAYLVEELIYHHIKKDANK